MPMFEGYIVANVGKAVLFHGNYWEEPEWMPKSQIDILRDEDSAEIRVLTSRWICDQKGLKEFTYRPKKEETSDTDY